MNPHCLYTTLKVIKAHRPCKDGWTELLTRLCKTRADDEPLLLELILDLNGLNDALWSIRTLSHTHNQAYMLYARFCAEKVLPLFEKQFPKDDRLRLALQIFSEKDIDFMSARVADASADATAAKIRAVKACAAFCGETDALRYSVASKTAGAVTAYIEAVYAFYNHNGYTNAALHASHTAMYAHFVVLPLPNSVLEEVLAEEFRRLCRREGPYKIYDKENCEN